MAFETINGVDVVTMSGFNCMSYSSLYYRCFHNVYSKTCLKRPLKTQTTIDFHFQLSLNAGQKYCRILQREHSAILSTFIKLPFSIKTFVLSFLCGRLKHVLLYKPFCKILELIAFVQKPPFIPPASTG